MNNFKKTFYGLGAITLCVTPILAVTSCSYPNEINNLKTLTLSIVQNKIKPFVAPSGNATANEKIKDYFYTTTPINGKSIDNTAVIQIKIDSNKNKDSNEIFIVIQGKADNSKGIITITILALYTVHYFYSQTKDNPKVINQTYDISGYAKP